MADTGDQTATVYMLVLFFHGCYANSCSNLGGNYYVLYSDFFFFFFLDLYSFENLV